MSQPPHLSMAWLQQTPSRPCGLQSDQYTPLSTVPVTCVFPLAPYLAQQLATLPRINEFVFASTGKAGRIADTRASQAKALQSASIESLTTHGLRPSFSLLGEAAGALAGTIAQVMATNSEPPPA